MFIIAANGEWTVGPDYTAIDGWFSSEKRGLLTIPTSGWLYADGGKFVDGDDTLKFIYN